MDEPANRILAASAPEPDAIVISPPVTGRLSATANIWSRSRAKQTALQLHVADGCHNLANVKGSRVVRISSLHPAHIREKAAREHVDVT